MDAISLLKDDHRAVERLFKRFEKTGDRAVVERRRIVDEIIKELSVHAEIEETVFYPAVRQAVPKTEDEVLEALEEHHVAKWVLSELDGMDPSAERFEAKVTVLMESVRHHVEEEESELFPQVRKAMSRKALDDMGDAMARAKTIAPTRPHPRSPDTPPGNIVSGVVASALDKAREAGQDLVEGAASVARRAAANATTPSSAKRTQRKATAKRKSSAKKATAKRKSSAKKAPARKTSASKAPAKRAARATAKKASGTAKKARTSAKKATRSTKSTARRATTSTKRTARKATGTAKSTARKASASTKRTARKATGTAKSTGRKATGTTKRTATRTTRKAAGATRKATGTTKRTAKKTSSRPRKAAKRP
jgi:hemerythrin superfamily protein